MVISMKDNGLKDNKMDTELTHVQTDSSILAIGKIIFGMVKDSKLLLMVLHMMVDGNVVRSMDMESLFSVMELDISVIS